MTVNGKIDVDGQTSVYGGLAGTGSVTTATVNNAAFNAPIMGATVTLVLDNPVANMTSGTWSIGGFQLTAGETIPAGTYKADTGVWALAEKVAEVTLTNVTVNDLDKVFTMADKVTKNSAISVNYTVPAGKTLVVTGGAVTGTIGLYGTSTLVIDYAAAFNGDKVVALENGATVQLTDNVLSLTNDTGWYRADGTPVNGSLSASFAGVYHAQNGNFVME